MKIKTVLISSSFDNNVYPKSVACVECTVVYKDFEFNFRFLRKADDHSIEDFVENDNLCQKEAFLQALKLLKMIVDPLQKLEQTGKLELEKESSLSSINVVPTDYKKITYKTKVIELVNLMNWSIDKLSKFVSRYRNKSLNQLNEDDWKELYEFLYQKIMIQKEDKELLKNRLKENIKENIEDELIKPEEWENII